VRAGDRDRVALTSVRRGCWTPRPAATSRISAAFTCNNKLISLRIHGRVPDRARLERRRVLQRRREDVLPRDSDSHGTTTTTAAGDCVGHAMLYGVDRGPVCGIAPGAHVIMYRV
jgi:hypothetical protein